MRSMSVPGDLPPPAVGPVDPQQRARLGMHLKQPIYWANGDPEAGVIEAPSSHTALELQDAWDQLGVPSFACDIIWSGRAFYVIGPSTRGRPQVQRKGAAHSLRLCPIAAMNLLKTPLSLLTNRIYPLGDIAPGLVCALAQAWEEGRPEGVLERSPGLAERYASTSTRRFYLAGATLLCGGWRVEHAASLVNLSHRQLERLFREMSGMTPKQAMQVVRLRRALAAAANGASLGDSALEGGYSDQAHFCNESRRLTGQTPGAMVAALRGSKSKQPRASGSLWTASDSLLSTGRAWSQWVGIPEEA